MISLLETRLMFILNNLLGLNLLQRNMLSKVCNVHQEIIFYINFYVDQIQFYDEFTFIQ